MARRFKALAFPVGGVALALLLLPAASAGPGATTRTSVSTGGVQGNGRSFVPAVSADGRFAAFYSDASNLVAGDTNGARDVFVHDRQTGETTRMSVDSTGTEANGDSFAPAISGDGRFVAFSSSGSNLVTGDTNGVNDVFVRDRQAGTTTRASVAPAGAEANDGSYAPSISADGRYVAFTSFAANLIPVDANDGSDVFVRDLQAGTTTRVSEYQGGFEADGDSLRPAISADGRFVAFDSDAWNLAWGDTNDAFDVFVKDRQTDIVTRVSVDDAGAQADGGSIRPTLSADGRFVAFYSDAANLVPGDTNGASDVILHDRRSGATKRVSVAGGGGEANGDSVRPALSADGRLIVFESDASNLVTRDSNRFTDIFLHDRAALAPPPPAPQVRCVVPRVIGLRLAVARARIGRANCRVGRVRRARSRRAGRVLSQSPRAGSLRPRGGRVNLVVGRH